MKRFSQVKTSALISYTAVGFNAVAGLIYTPWMVASIGAADYGLYTLAISVVTLFLMDFGMGSAVSKFLSEYYARHEDEKADNLLGIVYKLFMILTAVISVALVVVYFHLGSIYGELTSSELATFKVLYVVVATYSVLAFPFLPLDGVLLSNEKLIALRLCALIQKVLTVTLIIVCLLLGQGVFALVAVNAISSLLFVAIKMWIVRRTTSIRANLAHRDRGMTRHVFGFSGWVTATQIAQRLIFSIAPSVLAMLAGAVDIATFGLASVLEGYVYSVSQALNGLFLPRVSRIVAQDDSSGGVLELMVFVGRIQTYIIGLIVIGFACLGRGFVEVWMGDGFSALYVSALVLMLPSMVALPQQIASTAILATGNVKSEALVQISTGAVNILLMLLLVGRFGSTGACVSIALAYFIRTVAMNVVYVRKLEIDVFAFFRRTYGTWILPATISMVSGFAISHLIATPGWTGIGIEVLLFAVVYSAAMFVMALNQNEKKLIGSMLPSGR